MVAHLSMTATRSTGARVERASVSNEQPFTLPITITYCINNMSSILIGAKGEGWKDKAM